MPEPCTELLLNRERKRPASVGLAGRSSDIASGEKRGGMAILPHTACVSVNDALDAAPHEAERRRYQGERCCRTRAPIWEWEVPGVDAHAQNGPPSVRCYFVDRLMPRAPGRPGFPVTTRSRFRKPVLCRTGCF